MKTNRWAVGLLVGAVLGLWLWSGPASGQRADTPKKVSTASEVTEPGEMTIEDIKGQMEQAAPLRVAQGVTTATRRGQGPVDLEKFNREMALAMRLAKDRVLTDNATEQYFANVATRIDHDLVVDEGTVTYSVRADGVEDLLIVAGTKSDVRLVIGTRDATAADVDYQIAVHLALNGTEQRVVQMNGVVLSPQAVIGSLEAQVALTPTDGGVAQFNNEVYCLGFTDSGNRIRIVCIEVKCTSAGCTGRIVYDSGWLA